MAMFLAAGAGLFAMRHPALAEVAARSKTAIFHLDAMTCALCKHTVQAALGSVAGVERSAAAPSRGRTAVTIGPRVQPQTLAAAITAAGYPAHLLEVR